MLQSPFEALDVCRSKSQFARTLQDEKSVLEFRVDESVNDFGSSVRRAVVNYEDMKTLLQTIDGADYFLYVFLLVVSRNYDYAIAFFQFSIYFFNAKSQSFSVCALPCLCV